MNSLNTSVITSHIRWCQQILKALSTGCINIDPVKSQVLIPCALNRATKKSSCFLMLAIALPRFRPTSPVFLSNSLAFPAGVCRSCCVVLGALDYRLWKPVGSPWWVDGMIMLDHRPEPWPRASDGSVEPQQPRCVYLLFTRGFPKCVKNLFVITCGCKHRGRLEFFLGFMSFRLLKITQRLGSEGFICRPGFNCVSLYPVWLSQLAS